MKEILNPKLIRDWTSAKTKSQRYIVKRMVIILYILTKKPQNVFISISLVPNHI